MKKYGEKKIVKHSVAQNANQPIEVEDKIIIMRNQPILLDRDVAELYGVQTREINQAVKNNPEKFPQGYILELKDEEIESLKSKVLISNGTRGGSRWTPKAFTEKGLYMLATILKGKRAVEATLEIIETYAKVRELQRDLVALHRETDSEKKQSLMSRFSAALSDIVLPELRPDETETSVELNFIIGKIKHTVKRKRYPDSEDEVFEVREEEVPYGKE